MIKLDLLAPNAVKVIVPETLMDGDFADIAPKVDAIIKEAGAIRLVVDASRFNGWENIASFENHVSFVKGHVGKVERVAFIAGHEWQHWLISMVKMFVHPVVKVFAKGEEQEAIKWVLE